MSLEQRSAFRIQLPEGQKGATLRFEGKKYDVQLVDASASGVAIACPLHCNVEVDQECELVTASGGGVIRIVRKEVFPDGILLGALRTGDLTSNHLSWLGKAHEVAALPLQILAGWTLPTRIGVFTVACALVIVGFIYAYPRPTEGTPRLSTDLPAREVVEYAPSPEEVQEALRRLEAAMPPLEQKLSESDQRAQRIFAQQKQLLVPEIAHKLRLTPTQESRIERALAPAEEASVDVQDPQFWEAIRRAETQILGILTPAQVKAWRQQSGS